MIEASPKRNIFLRFLIWHFFEQSKSLLKAFKNFLVFNFNFFSIAQLGKTLFSHWRRYKEAYGRGLDIKRYARVFTSNMISRCMGAFIRTVTIIVGLMVEFFVFIGGTIVFLAWLFLPILLLFGLYFGIRLLL